MSGFFRVQGYDAQGLAKMSRAGDVPFNPAIPAAVSADSAQTITVAQLLAGLYLRSGMTAGRTDTTDTAANILAALPNMDIGDSIQLYISNTVAFALTIAGGTGVTMGSKVTVPASGSGVLFLTKTGAATMAGLLL